MYRTQTQNEFSKINQNCTTMLNNMYEAVTRAKTLDKICNDIDYDEYKKLCMDIQEKFYFLIEHNKKTYEKVRATWE